MEVSINNLADVTMQQVYEHVVTHLLNQGKQATNVECVTHTACVYRSEDGLKCAAGCLIPDADYNAQLESLTWYGLIEGYDFPKEHADLIGHLQSVHDCINPTEWKKVLIDIASGYQLNPAFIHDLQDNTPNESI